MKNNIKIIIYFLTFLLILTSKLESVEQFNFDITEIEIIENGGKFKGSKRGTITSDNGIIIDGDEFIYDKKSNTLNVKGKVKITDKINKYTIFSDNITYLKNEEIISTSGNSKVINEQIIFLADKFEYEKNMNQIIAKKNVKIDDKKENIIILAEKITYKKKKEQILSEGPTEIKIQKKYKIYSKSILLNRNSMNLSSNNNTKIYDNNFNLFESDEFEYSINDNFLKGKNIKVTSDINLDKEFSNKIIIQSGFFNLKNGNFDAAGTEIKMKKNIFGNNENDPRLKGISSQKNNEITKINKAIFTSCKKNDKCPPWKIQAEKITHDSKKKQLIYDNAILKIYDLPVVYFPKFFHPDPSVERQSGVLLPTFNESKILGSSVKIPYFHTLSKNKDITIIPNIFNKDLFMLENEFRFKTKQSSFLADFGFTRGYKSSSTNKKKNISHLFANYKLDFDLEDYITSNLDLKIEKVTNDNYLKVFDSNLSETNIKPTNKDILTSSLDLSFENDKFSFSTGLNSYENLSGTNSDRYQFILPYYNFSKNLFTDQNILRVNLGSSGSNNLKNTNNLRSRIINNLSLESLDYISKAGFKNNFTIFSKNLNTVAKNDEIYKSSPQIELMGMFDATTSLPLIKLGKKYEQFIEPKISFRINPSDMKDYSNSDRRIDVSNVFNIDRLGLADTLEEGNSLTVGLEYKQDNIKDINKYFELKIASVFRDKDGEKIPNSSSIKQSGNLIGSIKNNFNKHASLIYDFSVDNDLHTLEYNSLSANLEINNFFTSIKFLEESGKIGDSNSLENTFSYKFDENNFLSFNTRRNRKISLTEFYDLAYEYKNDCLTAAVKYKKSYYQDRDLLPTEDFMISITIFPLTTYEQNFDRD
tara:strand:- start:2044 stop:4662 length:2619 start_codon:yes stop_codon:yes gene_type:complete